jgi:hypothetical protein
MKKLILVSFFSAIALIASAQGLYNNGAHVVVSGSTYLVVDGTAGNVQNESGVIDLTGKLKLGGNFTNNVTAANAFGTLTTGSEVIFAGSGTQTIGGSSTAVFSFDKLTVNSGASVQLDLAKQITLTGSLTNNGTFTLKTNDDNATSTLIDNGYTGSGTCKMETKLLTGRNWYLSSPVASATSAVLNTTQWYPLMAYNEPLGSTEPWDIITDDQTPLAVTKGYIANFLNQNDVYTFTGGAFNTGNISTGANGAPALTRTAGQLKEGFNLVGNPYPSYVNIQSATKTNIIPTYWYRTANIDGTVYYFDTYNLASEVGISLSGKSVTNYIPPMQAFWVRIEQGFSSGSISFSNALRSHKEVQNNLFRAPAVAGQQIIRLRVSNGTNSDETLVVFNPLASDGYDMYDSPKMSNGSTAIPEIYSKAGNEIVAINGLKTFDSERILPLGFSTGQTTSFTLKATEISGFDSSFRLVLVDKNKPAEYDLTAGTDYTFNSSVVNNSDRFELKFKISGPTTATENAISDGINFIRKDNNHIWITYSGIVNKGSFAILYNAAGQAISNKLIESETTNVTLPTMSGIYMLKAIVSGKTKTSKVILK